MGWGLGYVGWVGSVRRVLAWVGALEANQTREMGSELDRKKIRGPNQAKKRAAQEEPTSNPIQSLYRHLPNLNLTMTAERAGGGASLPQTFFFFWTPKLVQLLMTMVRMMPVPRADYR